jgi:hypothetical protein
MTWPLVQLGLEPAMSDRISLYDESGTKINLGPNEYLTSGGEGAVYLKGSDIFKVYLDPTKARAARVPGKAELLKKFNHPGIASPKELLRDKSGEFVGLRFTKVEGEALCKLYTNSWRDAHQFGLKETQEVALRMREVMDYAHGQNSLLVDANELNWLVDKTRPVAIDVDSWQLPGYPATAIMPSIRDPLATTGFSEGSDWFAWAIVTFQLWTGIHPYKGTHPAFQRGALAARMKAQVSVFDSNVSTPSATRSITDIPAVLRTWYQDVFQAGLRVAPPSQFLGAVAGQTAPRLRVTQLANTSLRQERLGNTGGRTLAAFQGFIVVRTSAGLVVWDSLRKAVLKWVTADMAERILSRFAIIIRTATGEALVSLAPGKGLTLESSDKATSAADLPCNATRLWQSGSRLFALVEGVSNGLQEFLVATVGDRQCLMYGNQWPVSTLSTEFYRNCFVQNCLGAPFLGVLEKDGLVQLRAPALTGYRVVQGLGLDQHNVWLTAIRKNDGESVRLCLSAVANCFEVTREDVVAETDLDGALLSTGVGVIRLESDLQVSKGPHRKLVVGCGFGDRVRLFSMGSSLGLYEDSEVSKLILS